MDFIKTSLSRELRMGFNASQAHTHTHIMVSIELNSASLKPKFI